MRLIVTIIIIAIILIIATGVILSRKRKPFNPIITTEHGLVSIGVIIIYTIIVCHQHKVVGSFSSDLLFIILGHYNF